MAARIVLTLRVSAVACLALMVCGCGSDQSNMAEVTGKVLIDGVPLNTGSVMTVPSSGPGANGIINEQGEFHLTTHNARGASIGRHHVAVAAFEETANWNPEAPKKSLIPQKYTSTETSGLTIDVKADEPNEVVLELSSKGQ